MEKYVNIIKEIIRNHPEDINLDKTINRNKIILNRKKRYYIINTSINIPKHYISIIKIKKEFYKKYFLIESSYDTDINYIIKYKNEVIPINSGIYNRIETMWNILIYDRIVDNEIEESII